jgi:hypothetical protein
LLHNHLAAFVGVIPLPGSWHTQELFFAREKPNNHSSANQREIMQQSQENAYLCY